MKTNLLLCIILFLLSGTLSAQERGVTPSNHQTIQPSNHQTNTYAVVIGISDYQNDRIPDLKYAHKDAEAFANFLRSPAGGGLDQDQLTVLLNEQATGGQMVNALTWLMEVAQEGDNIIIYFSGHGDVETQTKFNFGYLLNWDSPPDTYMVGAFKIADLQAIVATLTEENLARVILITDACRAGKLAGNEIGGAQITTANLAKQFSNEIKLLSCQPDEYSIEGAQWGGGRGAFSYHLVNGLYGMADADQDNSVTLQELGRYLQDQVSKEVAPENQMPMFMGNNRTQLSAVDTSLLRDIRQSTESQIRIFSSIDTKGMEEDVLTTVDSATRALYAQFKHALSEKRFLFPENDCAEAYYLQLIQESRMARLFSRMRRNYAAALQDDAQQLINARLESKDIACFIFIDYARETIAKILHYPAYLKRAATLLGPDHYMYPTLMAYSLYFEGYIIEQYIRIDPSKYNEQAILEKYTTALKYNPDNPLVLLHLGWLYGGSKLGRSDLAEEYFNKVLTENPKWAFAFEEYGRYLYEDAGAFEKSKIALDKAYQLDSNSAGILLHLGRWYYKLGNYEAAEKYLKKMATLIPIDHCANWDLLSTYRSLHQHEKVIEISLKYIQEDSTNLLRYLHLQAAYLSLGQYELAQKTLDKAADIITGDGPLDTLLREQTGILHMVTGNFEAADQVLMESVSNNPDNFYALHLLYYLRRLEGKTQESRQILDNLMRTDSVQLLDLMSRSVRSVQWGDTSSLFFQKTTDFFQFITEQYPYNATAHVELALVLGYKGEVDAAYQHLETALRLGFDLRPKLEQHMHLKALREQKERWGALLNKYFPDKM
ncbi:MAG: hypothetical protein EP344_13640 [Bacteroidetes bacterium]|nr:MAG: hypothetical protein EP344_13640 [Bacteroidota bacterium]